MLLLLWLAGLSITLASAEEWKLVWSDEFDDDSLNENYWTKRVGFLGVNAEFQTYTDKSENVQVKDGKLQLSAIRDLTAQVGYTSGRVNTLDKVMVKYGMVEASIKIPNMKKGLWPAFWTLGENYPEVGWPYAGELDILEAGQKLGSSQGLGNNRVVTAFHWDAFGEYVVDDAYLDLPYDLSAGFSSYKMIWQPDYVETYVDDNLMHSLRIDNCDTLWDCPELHQFHFLILNLAVAGHFTCCEYGFELNDFPNGTAWTMEVDYVRVYGNEHTEVILPEDYVMQTAAPTIPTASPTMQPSLQGATVVPTEAPAVAQTAPPTGSMSSTESPTDPPVASQGTSPPSADATTVNPETPAPTTSIAGGDGQGSSSGSDTAPPSSVATTAAPSSTIFSTAPPLIPPETALPTATESTVQPTSAPPSASPSTAAPDASASPVTTTPEATTGPTTAAPVNSVPEPLSSTVSPTTAPSTAAPTSVPTAVSSSGSVASAPVTPSPGAISATQDPSEDTLTLLQDLLLDVTGAPTQSVTEGLAEEAVDDVNSTATLTPTAVTPFPTPGPSELSYTSNEEPMTSSPTNNASSDVQEDLIFGDEIVVGKTQPEAQGLRSSALPMRIQQSVSLVLVSLYLVV